MQLVQTLGQIWRQSVKIHSQLSLRKLPVTSPTQRPQSERDKFLSFLTQRPQSNTVVISLEFLKVGRQRDPVLTQPIGQRFLFFRVNENQLYLLLDRPLIYKISVCN